MDDAFGNWLAGFIDGEGCFRIAKRHQRYYAYGCFFSITLRADDEPVLWEIQRRTGFGRVRSYPHQRNAAACYSVETRAECLALIEILDRYPLRAKKARDYAIWREAVQRWAALKHRGCLSTAETWAEVAELADRLRDTREYREAA